MIHSLVEKKKKDVQSGYKPHLVWQPLRGEGQIWIKISNILKLDF